MANPRNNVTSAERAARLDGERYMYPAYMRYDTDPAVIFWFERLEDRAEFAELFNRLHSVYGHLTTVTCPDVWTEYDHAADWCARRGHSGKPGDPLPTLLSTACHELINGDPESFAKRVSATAYAIAMNKIHEQNGDDDQ